MLKKRDEATLSDLQDIHDQKAPEVMCKEMDLWAVVGDTRLSKGEHVLNHPYLLSHSRSYVDWHRGEQKESG